VAETPSRAGGPSPPGAVPSVVVIVLDDLGFADLGCYGSELETPNLDRLAREGLRYNNFHVTALCSPTRACVLTGRNHHAVGMGVIPELAAGPPGYQCRIPASAGTLARVLRDAGYGAFAVGKWHLTPRAERTAAGPFGRWPLGMGFERFYGFTGGVTSQWTPDLVCDNGFVEPPSTPGEDYHLTEDLANRAIRLVGDLRQAAPGRPFFLYFATGAVHYPHQVPRPWIECYRHRFDDGWEAVRRRRFDRQVELGVVPASAALTPRPPWVQPWEGLSVDERRFHARQMEVYGGFLTHTDAQIGRLLDFLEGIGRLDDTIVMVLSDNGASGEGGPRGWTNPAGFGRAEGDGAGAESRARAIDELGGFRTYDLYGWGWAWAGNTPFRLWKRYTWLGGVRVPLIVRWPDRIPAGQRGRVRSQFCHAIDIMPTILDAAGVALPDSLDGVPQQAVDGRSLMRTFADADAAPPRSTQYFEIFGSRSIYHDGWKATTDHIHHAMTAEREHITGSRRFADDTWSLYHLSSDFSEAHDLAHAHPEHVRRMVALWWSEAERNQVLPLLESSEVEGPLAGAEPLPGARLAELALLANTGPVVPPSLVEGFRVTAEVEIATGGRDQGVVCAQGDWNGGWALYLLDGVVVVSFTLGATTSSFRGGAVGPGRHRLELAYAPGPPAGGSATIVVDGNAVAAGAVVGERHHLEAVDYYGKLLVGRDHGFPVCNDYWPPFPFTGEIHSLRIAAGGT